MPQGKNTTRSRRNAAGSGTIRKKAVTRNGKVYEYWEGRYTVGFDSGTGKQIQKSVTGKTQKEVAEKMRQATHELDTGEYIEPCKMTLGEWLDIWKTDYLMGVKNSTVDVYVSNIEAHIKPALGAVRLDMLTPHEIQRFYNTLKNSGGRVAAHGKDGSIIKKNGETVYKTIPLSAKTVKGVHGVLHSALRQAQRNGYIRYNPTDSCILPRCVKRTLVPLDEDETRAFLHEIKGNHFETLFTVTLFTGLRISEVLGLTWDCVDFDTASLLIEKQLRQIKHSGGKYEFTLTKNSKARTVVVAPWVAELLRHHKACQTEQRLKAGSCWQDGNLVFTNEAGEHLAYRTVIKAYKKVVTAIGRPDARFHDLRHSYAVAAIRSGDDIKTVQGNLGHATAAFTLDQYGYVTDQMKQASAERMDAYIQRVLPE